MTEEEFDADFENYIERERMIEKASSVHVPGHGPDFEEMTNEQIERHIDMIENTFKMLFDEDEGDKNKRT
ncbi:hypothetical protein HOO54_15720 [Bacillus sp. WMMC1349]|nr:hypothetical protein [Bacillus sp. WMMC1349]